MAHQDGRHDGFGEQSNDDEPEDNQSGTSSHEQSWTVINSNDFSTTNDLSRIPTCCIGSNEDYPSGDCLQSNSTPECSTFGPQAMPSEVNGDLADTQLKEVIDFQVQEQVDTFEPGHAVVVPSDLGSSFGTASTCPDYDCDECSLIASKLPSQESIEFWKSIPRKGLDDSGCHIKFFEKFITSMKEFSKAEELLKDSKVLNLLKTLLKVSLADETAVVEYKNFARLVKYLGPVRKKECVLLEQIHNIKESSVVKDKKRKEKLCWFAGEMTRDDAENILKTQLCGTYLVRMSQTTVGAFVISVKHEDNVEHVEMLSDFINAVNTDPYDARLILNGRTYASVAKAVNSLKTQPLIIAEEADEEEDDVEEGARGSVDVFCKYCCPNLPLNGVISGYRKTKR